MLHSQIWLKNWQFIHRLTGTFLWIYAACFVPGRDWLHEGFLFAYKKSGNKIRHILFNLLLWWLDVNWEPHVHAVWNLQFLCLWSLVIVHVDPVHVEWLKWWLHRYEKDFKLLGKEHGEFVPKVDWWSIYFVLSVVHFQYICAVINRTYICTHCVHSLVHNTCMNTNKQMMVQ